MHVCTPGERLGQQLLGRHIGNLPLDLAPRSCAQPSLGSRDAKIRHTRHSVPTDQDVVRRDVAVHKIDTVALVILEIMGGV